MTVHPLDYLVPPDSLTPEQAEIWTAAIDAAKEALCSCGNSPIRDPKCPVDAHRAEAAEQDPRSQESPS
jgi:hypothetical protein